jgi:crotonobetainyl-CoA:carnitine CoA-transferase CaiB-like acyl-CoA transferase
MTARSKQDGPLTGMKVIELAHIMAGPVCGLMLADMGASVIKVEKYPGGDDSRRFLPPEIGGESAAYMMMNRNKRGLALDLKSEAGKEVLRRMLMDADAVIENYRAGTMEGLGFGYDSLRKSNAGLIYCSLSGFGRTGPYAGRGGFDLIAQGMSGLMSITGEGPGRPPVKCGAPITDITAGILAAMGVLAAYTHKLRTGKGQAIDTSLFEAGIVHTYWQSAICFATGVSPRPMGSAHPLNGPYQAFQTADGWVTVGAANQANWLRLIEVLEAKTLGDDPRFSNNAARMTNLKALEDELKPYFKRKGCTEWLERFELAGLPVGPVLDIAGMQSDPQTLARQMVTSVDHTTAGQVKTIGLPVKFSETPGTIRTGAPLLGEHSREILSEHGYSEDDIDALIRQGVIGIPEAAALSAAVQI